MGSQISNYIGKIVEVIQPDGTLVTGCLRFFNFQAQVIHLSEYTRINLNLKDEGEFYVINACDWKTIKVVESGKRSK
jgi:hypothetical protein